MFDKLTQYKGSASESSWENLFLGYDVEQKVELMQKSRLFYLLFKYLKKEDKIMEAGCGMGKLSLALLDAGFDMIGIDYSEKLINKIQLARPQLKNHFICMDARKFDFSKEVFDAVISPGVIEHFHEPEQAVMLKEIYRVLKPNGRLLCIVPFMNWIKVLKAPLIQKAYNKKRDSGVGFYQYVYSVGALRKLLSMRGFNIEKVELLGLHDTRLFGKKIIPVWLQNNSFLLRLFGTTMIAMCKKK
ncbi:MAG: class I SAM-dependent methyltransferase [Candidatus Woesearchaeota archaeon]|nr:class I SAM-dependent methyltransferase [Candidatus Woesearchaeota archaeon]